MTTYLLNESRLSLTTDHAGASTDCPVLIREGNRAPNMSDQFSEDLSLIRPTSGRIDPDRGRHPFASPTPMR